MRPHRGMLGKESSKRTAADCGPPASCKATGELQVERERSSNDNLCPSVTHIVSSKSACVRLPLSSFVTLKSIRKLRVAVRMPRAA